MAGHIITYLFLITNLVTSLISYKILTKDKIKINFLNIIMLLGLTFITVLARYYNNGLITLLSNILFIYIVLRVFYEIKHNKTIYYTFIISIISLFCDAIMSVVISNTYLLDLKVFQKNYALRGLLNIPVCLLIIGISCLPFIKRGTTKYFEKYFSKVRFSKISSLFLITISLIFSIAFCLNSYKEIDKLGHTIILLGIGIFILLVIIIFYLLYKEHETEQCNKRIIAENNYIKTIAKQDEIFKHNIVNNLLGIKTVSNKKTNKLIDVLIEDYQKEYKNITNINDLPNGIQSIIYKKAYEENVEHLNLIVENNIKDDLYDLLTPKKYNHLCTSIGILFDNALEAVKNSDLKIIEIEFSEDKEFVYFEIKNSYTNVIDLDKIGTKRFTTKRFGHGIGLNYVLRLKTLSVKNELINNLFVTKLTIKKAAK